jgi:hypothetical protein
MSTNSGVKFFFATEAPEYGSGHRTPDKHAGRRPLALAYLRAQPRGVGGGESGVGVFWNGGPSWKPARRSSLAPVATK